MGASTQPLSQAIIRPLSLDSRLRGNDNITVIARNAVTWQSYRLKPIFLRRKVNKPEDCHGLHCIAASQ